MERAAVLLVMLALVTVVSAQSGQAPSEGTPQPSVALPPALARVLTDYEQAWTRRDAVALAQLFAEDGWVLSPGQPPIKGRAAIERAYAKRGGGLSLRPLAFEAHGTVGYVIGAFASAKGEPDIGKFTLTLRLTGDRWLIVSDMDNGNRAPR